MGWDNSYWGINDYSQSVTKVFHVLVVHRRGIGCCNQLWLHSWWFGVTQLPEKHLYSWPDGIYLFFWAARQKLLYKCNIPRLLHWQKTFSGSLMKFFTVPGRTSGQDEVKFINWSTSLVEPKVKNKILKSWGCLCRIRKQSENMNINNLASWLFMFIPTSLLQCWSWNHLIQLDYYRIFKKGIGNVA